MATESGRILYDDSQREAVYKVWVLRANRNAEATSRMLPGDDMCVELGVVDVTSRTIRNWAKEHSWDIRADRELFAGVDVFRYRTNTTLMVAAPDAADLMRRVLIADESLMTDMWVDVWHEDEATGKYSKAKEKVKGFDPNIIKLQITAAQMVLDRWGFSPVGTRSLGSIEAPPEVSGDFSAELAALDTSDPVAIAEFERTMRAKLGIGRQEGDTTQRKAGQGGRPS